MAKGNGRPPAPNGAKTKWADGRVVEKVSGGWNFTGGEANAWNTQGTPKGPTGVGGKVSGSKNSGTKIIANKVRVLSDGSVARSEFSGDTKIIKRVRKG